MNNNQDIVQVSYEEYKLLKKLRIPPDEIKNALKRYIKINQIRSRHLYFIPTNPDILAKIVEPLNYAEEMFMLGNYLGTIALCGFLNEMITIVYYEMVLIENTCHNIKNELSSFERNGQSARIDKIVKYPKGKTIEPLSRNLANKRKLYLHYFSQKNANIEDDALECYNEIIQIIKTITGLGISRTQSGVTNIDPDFILYLEKKGEKLERNENGNIILPGYVCACDIEDTDDLIEWYRNPKD